MERVAFVPSGVRPPASAVELGAGTGGSWVSCDDDALLAGVGQIDLLWLSRDAYDHAVRRIDQGEVAKVVALRRADFSLRLPSRAKAELFAMALRVLPVAAKTHAREAFARWLAILARLAGASRFKGIGDVGLLERLLEREQAVRNELDSREGQPEVAPGEIDARKRLANETAQLLSTLGRPEYAQAPLYVALVRGYLLVPPPAHLIADWRRDGIEAVPWRSGVIGPLQVDEAADLQRSLVEVKAMFPDPNMAAALRRSLTPAQLTVELEDRETNLNMTAHVAGVRVELATFRRNIARVMSDAACAGVLADQIAAETTIVMAAYAARPPYVAAKAPGPAEAAADFIAAATLLSKLVALHGLGGQVLAAELLAIAKDG